MMQFHKALPWLWLLALAVSLLAYRVFFVTARRLATADWSQTHA